jgi:predicted transcriptional regulator
MTDWQDRRAMSPREFERSVLALDVSVAAMGRFLGVSERTVYRFLSGDAEVPASAVLLIRLMLEQGIKPRTPKRQKRPRPVVAEHPTPPTA